MTKSQIASIIDGEGTDASKLDAIKALLAQSSGDGRHFLARAFNVANLGELKAGMVYDYAELYIKYNEQRQRNPGEEAGRMKDLPTQMWRDQGISFETTMSNGKLCFVFKAYDHAKHDKFRLRNNEASRVQKAKAKAGKEVAGAIVPVQKAQLVKKSA